MFIINNFLAYSFYRNEKIIENLSIKNKVFVEEKLGSIQDKLFSSSENILDNKQKHKTLTSPKQKYKENTIIKEKVVEEQKKLCGDIQKRISNIINKNDEYNDVHDSIVSMKYLDILHNDLSLCYNKLHNEILTKNKI